MTIHRVPQRSPEWHALRCGHLTGSSARDVVAKGKGGAESSARVQLRDRLVAEMLTGIPEAGGYTNADMQRGIDCEPLAVALYEAREGELVDTSAGFVQATGVLAGYSPDGLVGDDGVLECKCPKTSTHLGYLRDPYSLAKAYWAQILHGLWVTERQWCDIVSFDDRLPERYRYVRCRVERGPEVDAYAKAARAFLDEVQLELASYKGWEILQETA